MKIAVRYYSRGGNVKLIAEALAKGAGVEAISIDDADGPLQGPVDLLFIGGAIYRLKLDPKLIEYIEAIPSEYLRRVVCFGSSATTRRPVYSLQELFRKKGVEIATQAVYARNKPKPTALAAFEFFAKKESERDLDEEPLPPIAYMIRAVKDEQRAKEEREEAQRRADELGITLDEYLREDREARELAMAAEQASNKAKMAAEEASELLAKAQEAAARAAELAEQAKEAERNAVVAAEEAEAANAATAAEASKSAPADQPAAVETEEAPIASEAREVAATASEEAGNSAIPGTDQPAAPDTYKAMTDGSAGEQARDDDATDVEAATAADAAADE